MVNFWKDGVLSTIYPYIKKKEVLDIGCVDHDIRRRNKSRIWPHGFFKKYTKSVSGIDILEKDVNFLKKEGYDVSCQNAESFSFKSKFDVIFAGELIEHLSNPGNFLDRCHNHLKDDGYLILTTPNAFCGFRWLEMVYKYTNNPHASKAKEHTVWFSPEVIEVLLERHGFKIERLDYAYYPFLRKDTFKWKILKVLIKLTNKKFKDTMIVIARPSDKKQ